MTTGLPPQARGAHELHAEDAPQHSTASALLSISVALGILAHYVVLAAVVFVAASPRLAAATGGIALAFFGAATLVALAAFRKR